MHIFWWCQLSDLHYVENTLLLYNTFLEIRQINNQYLTF